MSDLSQCAADWRWSAECRAERTLATEPEPEWSEVDCCGHVHRWEGDEVPTLTVVRRCPWTHRLRRWLGMPLHCHCESSTVCRECGAVVRPARREVVLVSTGRIEFGATVSVPMDTARELLSGPGETVRLERFFADLEGEAIVREVAGRHAQRAVGEPWVELDLLAIGTVKMRQQEGTP